MELYIKFPENEKGFVKINKVLETRNELRLYTGISKIDLSPSH